MDARTHAPDPTLVLGQFIFVLLAEFLVLLLAGFLLATKAIPFWAAITIMVAASLASLPILILLGLRLKKAQTTRLRETTAVLGLAIDDDTKAPVHAERYDTAVEGGLDLPTGPNGVKWSAAGGIDGRETLLFHHVHVVQAGQTPVAVSKLLAASRCPDHWPVLSLAPETLGHRIADLFGSRDIQLEDPRFNQRWRVKCDDEDFAIAVLTPELQAFLLDAPRTEQWAIGRGWARVARRETVKPDLLPELARRPGELLALIPHGL